MTIKRYIYIYNVALALGCASLLTGCTDETAGEASSSNEMVMLHLNLDGFEGDPITRTTTEGTGFESSDRFRLQIICPHSNHHENGEPWSTSYHTIELSKATKSATSWVYGTVSSNEAQATTYIYTAQNTIDNRLFVINDYRYSRPSNFFYADQSKLDQLKKSDVVWAQAIRQTGAREVHLNFKHKVAKLDITIDDSKISADFSGNAILTLEGMPDIDGAEIVVGDYYADDSYQDENFSYRQKASCSYENNGKVLGIEVIDDANVRSKVWPMSGNPSDPGGANSSVFNPNGTGTATPVPNTGIYTAYHDPDDAKHFVMYVPVCDLDPSNEGGKNAVFWLREGTARYSIVLDQTDFEEGVCYKVKLSFGEFTPVKTAWTANASSQADDGHSAANAIDGDDETYWMSAVEADEQHPSIEIDLQRNYQISSITYTPRKDSNEGRIKEFEVYYKRPEQTEWYRLYVPITSFDYTTDVVQTIPFYSMWAQYIKLVAVSTEDGGNAASAAEIGIKAVGVK